MIVGDGAMRDTRGRLLLEVVGRQRVVLGDRRGSRRRPTSGGARSRRKSACCASSRAGRRVRGRLIHHAIAGDASQRRRIGAA
jgi:hypothetical protein